MSPPYEPLQADLARFSARRLQQAQGRLLVTGLQGVVAEIFKISRFDRILEVAPSLEAALSRAQGSSSPPAA